MTKPRPFGHYFILEKIAQGGMAEVFKGLTYDFSGLKKFIVIKRILPHIAAHPEFVEMLVSEAKIAVQLNHGNIAQIFDLGKVGQDYFIVMEYVEGKNLSQIQKRLKDLNQEIPIHCAVQILLELLTGLDYIHLKKDSEGQALGIVHRDVSPQNIIVSHAGGVKIIDFGVAQASFKTLKVEDGILKGKFAYMSPEQADGAEVNYSSDLFSAGIVFWELLTGRRLFKKETNSLTVEAVKNENAMPPSLYRSEISKELDQIILKALEKNAENRYLSAMDFAQALNRYKIEHFPYFKSQDLALWINELFDHSKTDHPNLFFDRTIRDELKNFDQTNTLIDSTQSIVIKPEETAVVKSGEIDFKSIFDDFEWDFIESNSKSTTHTKKTSKDSEPILNLELESISEKQNKQLANITKNDSTTLNQPPVNQLLSQKPLINPLTPENQKKYSFKSIILIILTLIIIFIIYFYKN